MNPKLNRRSPRASDPGGSLVGFMEYLIVHFPETRRVLIDGQDQGRTDRTIELEAGTYTVSLSPSDHVKPKKRTVTLSNTSPIKPREVAFGKT
ncbi:MAG TPA: PEGA domain-containing protein [Nitrospiria bacterium]|nr:PEGA domain-containing protein [Nitrospiria bacterium]